MTAKDDRYLRLGSLGPHGDFVVNVSGQFADRNAAIRLGTILVGLAHEAVEQDRGEESALLQLLRGGASGRRGEDGNGLHRFLGLIFLAVVFTEQLVEAEF